MSQQVQNAVVPASKAEFVEEIEKTFEVADVAALVVFISNLSGKVVVESWPQPTVQIRAVKRGRFRRSFDRTHVEIRQAGAEVRAGTRIDEEAIIAGVMDLLRGERVGATVEYTVRMPAAGALRARNLNGAIVVTGLSGRTELNTANGAITLSNLSGQLVAATVNGSLKAEGVSGAAELSTVNGSLELAGASLSRLDARTVSGSIRAGLQLAADGRYGFSTTNGNCELTLPANSGCTLTMESVNGGVDCALPHTTIASEMRPAFSSWQGAINGGGVPVSVRTINGRLLVLAGEVDVPAGASSKTTAQAAQPAGPAMPAGAAMSAAPAQPAERGIMDILRAVERARCDAGHGHGTCQDHNRGGAR